MKLKDVLSKIVKNKSSGQLNTSIKKKALKKAGMSEEDLFNIDIGADKNATKLLMRATHG